jgi:hypothetical protein
MSPYIVTTKRRGYMGLGLVRSPRVVSRRAVATLEEARDFIYSLCAETDVDDERIADDIDRLPESGGTVGPLPDGTVIEVEQVTWHELTHRTTNVGRYWLPADHGHTDAQAAILDAYNARQA